ncbi:MAG: hypothetical protein OEW85_14685, partial [Acidimicrobiia bacterium]|nr:hypothetical protein [Acidimicrobiia bacterium]
MGEYHEGTAPVGTKGALHSTGETQAPEMLHGARTDVIGRGEGRPVRRSLLEYHTVDPAVPQFEGEAQPDRTPAD